MLKFINKLHLYIYIILYIVFGIIGYFNTNDVTDGQITHNSSFSTFFFHNVNYGLLLTIGALSLGFLTLILHCANSYILGSVIKENILDNQTVLEILQALPHGLFEIPALYFFFNIGLSTLTIIIKYLLKENFYYNFYQYTIFIVKNLIFGVLLLVFAALAEAYISL